MESVPTGTFREIQEAFKQSQALYQELAATCAELQAATDEAPAAGAKQPPGKGLADGKKAAAGKVCTIARSGDQGCGQVNMDTQGRRSAARNAVHNLERVACVCPRFAFRVHMEACARR